jgi:hypothetical protein
MKNALIPGTPILALMGTCLLSWLSIPKKKLHRFFFNVINWPKIAENYEGFREKISQFYIKNADAPL